MISIVDVPSQIPVSPHEKTGRDRLAERYRPCVDHPIIPVLTEVQACESINHEVLTLEGLLFTHWYSCSMTTVSVGLARLPLL